MHIIYDDKDADRSVNSYRLILIAGGWHIVANGYLCKVADEAEGQRMLTALWTASPRSQPSIDKVQAGTYTSRPTPP